MEKLTQIQNEYLGLLEQKRAALGRMLSATEKESFTGEYQNREKESEAFIALFEKREAIVSKIEAIDDHLDALSIAMTDELEALWKDESQNIAEAEPNREFGPEHARLSEEIKTLAKRIMDLDKANNIVAEKIFLNIKSDVKQARDVKNVSGKYNNDGHNISGHILDKKN